MVMATSTPPVGLDHPTVVPANFEREAEPDTGGSDQDTER